jgi:hypothetical protein
MNPQEPRAMLFARTNDLPWPKPQLSVQPQPERERKKRILAALGLPSSQHLRVDEESLTRYYDYLAAHLKLPFAACYPRPTTPEEAAEDRCEVIKLLDPRTALCDEFDGIYCQTHKGRFVVNLPLVELTVLSPGKNLDLLADYEYWFWNWRN